jgi:hypothetical protein
LAIFLLVFETIQMIGITCLPIYQPEFIMTNPSPPAPPVFLGCEGPPASLNGAEWGTSEAKRLIAQDMMDNLVPYLEKINNPFRLFEEFYANQPEFKNFPYDQKRYAARFKRIQDVVRRLKWSSAYDQECYDEFRAKYPQQTHGPTGKALWKDSEADRLLKQMMAQGLHLTMKPGAIFDTQAEFQPFGKRRLAKRIDQLKEAAKPYGTNPMQAAAKRAKKDLKKVKDHQEISRHGDMDQYNNSN